MPPGVIAPARSQGNSTAAPTTAASPTDNGATLYVASSDAPARSSAPIISNTVAAPRAKKAAHAPATAAAHSNSTTVTMPMTDRDAMRPSSGRAAASRTTAKSAAAPSLARSSASHRTVSVAAADTNVRAMRPAGSGSAAPLNSSRATTATSSHKTTPVNCQAASSTPERSSSQTSSDREGTAMVTAGTSGDRPMAAMGAPTADGRGRAAKAINAAPVSSRVSKAMGNKDIEGWILDPYGPGGNAGGHSLRLRHVGRVGYPPSGSDGAGRGTGKQPARQGQFSTSR